MISRPSASVTREIALHLVVPGDTAVPLPVTMRYDSRDPYAVHATFRTGRGEGVEWVFARDLLAAGMSRHVGEGDVRVWPGSQDGVEVVYIALTSPDGEALLAAPAGELAEFVRRAQALVPDGSESRYLDLDGAITALLAG